MNRAVISLGTNTTRLLVVHDLVGGGVEQLEHGQTGTRLGEGLRGAGELQPSAMERTLDAVAGFVERARFHGARLSTIATSAVRRAENADRFGERMRALTGVALQVLPGNVEAAASFRGATFGRPHDGLRVAVVDVGGGSTECAVGCDGVLEDARSVEIGSVRLSERHPSIAGGAPGPAAHAAARAARKDAADSVAPLGAFRGVAQVYCVAGTALTIGAVAQGTDVERVSGTPLTRSAIEMTLGRLLDLGLAERRALRGMLPQRADILAGGALVVSEVLGALGAETAVLEANDLLLGFLLMDREACGTG